jgi:23S rRNA (uracil1939-C5)-methyltransferase
MQQETVLQITSLSSTGEGIGSLGGMKIFVEGALPNETVAIKITRPKKTYAQGELLSILKPSSERRDPPCPLFGECGGCQIMHLDYAAQLELKKRRVIDALQRIGKFTDLEVLPCLPSPTFLGYRNKIQLPVRWENGQQTMGLYRKNSHEIIPLTRCVIQCPQGEEILQLIKNRLTLPSVRYVLIRNAVFQKEALVIFVTTGRFSEELKKLAEGLIETNPVIKGVVENIHTSGNCILGPRFRTLAGRPFIYETLLNKTFKISASAFFQINPAQTEKLYEKALELSEIQPSEVVLDAYCGVGGLAILAADRAHHVYGIECVPSAIEDAITNARLNQIENGTFFCEKAETIIHQFDKLDVVFLNPPRKGCEPKLLRALLEKKPKRIIYISCDPATLARDCAQLRTHYEVTAVQPIDMFPQTMHVETIVRADLS